MGGQRAHAGNRHHDIGDALTQKETEERPITKNYGISDFDFKISDFGCKFQNVAKSKFGIKV